MKKFTCLLLLGVVLSGPLHAATTLNSLFSDNVVLQRDKPIPVWGTAPAGQKVTVAYRGQSATATAAQDGKWCAQLPAMAASDQPADLTATGDTTATVKNTLVGDVWLCSGQSNMERQLGLRNGQLPLDNWQAEAAAANFPLIREYFVPEKTSTVAATDAMGTWVVCSPDTAAKFSAVSFFFARALQPQIKVPIGLLFSSVGGTSAVTWTSHDALAANPALADILTGYEKAQQDYPAKLADYQAHQAEIMAKYNDDLAKATAANQKPPNKPGPPRNPAGTAPGCHFYPMIAPLIGYPIRGAIWYQGESDCGRAKEYEALFTTMITDWRARWGQGDFPFLFVQLAPYKGNNPELREAQLFTAQHVPHTAIAVITDVGDANNIHPTNKKPVGERLALAARAVAYGEKIEYSGPLFDSATVAGNKITVAFTHVGGGLVAKDGALKGFEIAGADKKFVPATATIAGDKVEVSADSISAPQYVRYGFTSVPDVNLWNADGLPASPFRSDKD
jgi:sialate O-acetylesterase